MTKLSRPLCRHCRTPVTHRKQDDGKWVPFEEDDTPHECKVLAKMNERLTSIGNSLISFRMVMYQGKEGIKCLKCGLVSFSTDDIEKRYCSRCDMKHSDNSTFEPEQTPAVVEHWPDVEGYCGACGEQGHLTGDCPAPKTLEELQAKLFDTEPERDGEGRVLSHEAHRIHDTEDNKAERESEEPPGDEGPMVRNTDPETSHDGAEFAVNALSKTRMMVYDSIKKLGDCICSEIEDDCGLVWNSASRRITGLIETGMVEVIGKREGPRGAMQRIVRVVQR